MMIRSPRHTTTPQPRSARASTINSTRPYEFNDSAMRLTNQRSSEASVLYPSSHGSDDNNPLQDGTVHASHTSTNARIIKDFKPYEQLYKTPIAIQLSQRNVSKHTVHLEILSCYSPAIAEMFRATEGLRESYEAFKSYRQDIKRLVRDISPETWSDPEEEVKLAGKAFGLIMQAWNGFPLPRCHAFVKKQLEKIVHEVIGDKKNLKLPPSTGGIKKKDVPDLLRDCLQLLNHQAYKMVLHMLSPCLRKIKQYEMTKIYQDREIAAAQGTIFVEGFNDIAIDSFKDWLYQKKLNFQDSEQLYNLYQLAELLDVKELADICVSKLINAAHMSVACANEQGVSLASLLQERSPPNNHDASSSVEDPLADVVQVVFRQVLKQKCSSIPLQRVVVDAIANSADMELFNSIRGYISQPMALELLEATFRRATKSKMEMGDDTIKIESEFLDQNHQSRPTEVE